jgi:hypothetical protein
MLGVTLIFLGLFFHSELGDTTVLFYFSGGLLSLSRFGTIVDTRTKTIKRYLSIFFFRLGFRKKYELLNCFWLSSTRMQDVWQSRSSVKTISSPYTVVYVYLLTSDGKEYYLFRASSKQAVYEKLAEHMQQLGIKCLDRNSI